jgi:hypothetical protein
VLVAAFKWLSVQLIVISGLLAGCSLIVWVIDGRQGVTGLIETAVLRMKAPWVWTFGYGLASFIGDRGRLLPAAINGVLVHNEVTAAVASRIERSTFHRNALRYTIPMSALGVFLTSVYGIPNKGVAYYLIFVGVCAIYYIAGFLLFHLIEVTLAFNDLYDSMDTVKFQWKYSPLHLENLTTYLALTTGVGLVAIYAGFRGTVTAGFEFRNEVWRAFLSTPIILFLPGTLLYNYYPRYVLRKILQYKVFRAMERLSKSNDEDKARAIVFELKESAVLNSQILPFIDYKTLPSYLIAIFFAISLVYRSDPAVKAFIKYLFNIGSE